MAKVGWAYSKKLTFKHSNASIAAALEMQSTDARVTLALQCLELFLVSDSDAPDHSHIPPTAAKVLAAHPQESPQVSAASAPLPQLLQRLVK